MRHYYVIVIFMKNIYCSRLHLFTRLIATHVQCRMLQKIKSSWDNSSCTHLNQHLTIDLLGGSLFTCLLDVIILPKSHVFGGESGGGGGGETS